MRLPELGSHVGREYPCGESLLRKRTEREREGKERKEEKGGKPKRIRSSAQSSWLWEMDAVQGIETS